MAREEVRGRAIRPDDIELPPTVRVELVWSVDPIGHTESESSS
jgi:hypothetical protein